MRFECACLWVWGLQALDRKRKSSIESAAKEVQAIVSAFSGSRFINLFAIHSQLACDLACEKTLSQAERLR